MNKALIKETQPAASVGSKSELCRDRGQNITVV